jgi:glycosyltransferase involved in cell wall biosynthesis
MPLVSVVIPTRNRPEMLAEAVASVLAQTFADYEIIVVSNGESADTRRASRQAAAGCVFIELDQGNVSAARNAGIEYAKGEWIAFLDDDDLWLPSKLERQLAEADRTGADMVACDYVEFSPDGEEILRRPRFPECWPRVKVLNRTDWWTCPSATLIRKRVLTKVGGFDPRFRRAEDNDLWRRLSWRHSIHQMDEILMRYRTGHPSAMQQRRICHFYDLHHAIKMRWDTPRDLRSMLPPATFILLRLAIVIAPAWLLRFRPRRRWIEFQHRLRSRTMQLGCDRRDI